jgi:hypothetical protein
MADLSIIGSLWDDQDKPLPCPKCQGRYSLFVPRSELLRRIREHAAGIDALSFFKNFDRGYKFRQCMPMYRSWKRCKGHVDHCPDCYSKSLILDGGPLELLEAVSM